MTRHRERLVILGSGWSSDVLLRNLDGTLYDVTVVTPTPNFLYTPLLASIAVGKLTLFAAMDATHRHGMRVYAASAEEIDLRRKSVRCRPNAGSEQADFEIGFDLLVIAVGCGVADFGTEGVRDHAQYFKTVNDALAVRNRILECFEAAALPGTSDEDKRRLLSFVIVGGGATGIELSGELSDLVDGDLSRLYGHLKPYVQISIYDVADTILPGYEQELQHYAMSFFERQNVKVETGRHITRVGPRSMHVKELGEIPVGLLIWSTGLDAVPLLKRGIKGTKQDDKTRNLIVDDHLRVLRRNGQAHQNVFACGDLCKPASGTLPPVGAVAHREGQYLAKLLCSRANGTKFDTPFEFRDSRKVSYLGSQQSVSQQGESGSTAGRASWALWREEYSRSLSLKRRIILFVYYCITWAFGRDLIRI